MGEQSNIKTYCGASDYVWLKTSNDDGLYDLVTGSHYAGCRCTLTKHPLEKCEGFATCLKSCLQSIKEKCPDNFIAVKQILNEKYEDTFDELKSETNKED